MKNHIFAEAVLSRAVPNTLGLEIQRVRFANATQNIGALKGSATACERRPTAQC